MAKLNNYLESFRAEVNKKYPKRKKTSDGTLGDQKHKARVSEHNADSDGTIDAWDMDVNLLGSTNDTGSAAEDAEVWKVIKDFMAQPESQLVIWNEHIYNRDIGNWKKRWYGNWSSGHNPHDHHVHFQGKQSKEDTKYHGKLGGDKVVDAQPTNKSDNKPTTGNLPHKPVAPTNFKELKVGSKGDNVLVLQKRLNDIFPDYSKLKEDGTYGEATKRVVAEFQKRAKIHSDGIVGKETQSKLMSYGIAI